MTTVQHNAHQVAQRYASAAVAIRQELGIELHGLAAEIAARMKVAAPKFRTTLTNSITADKRSELEWFVGPHVEYDLWVEKGRKPGKGLPPFFSPAAASAVAWLQGQLGATGLAGPVNPAWRKLKVGSKRRNQAELELRDRYTAWSRSVKLRGIKPSPFVKPTADAFRALVPTRLMAAVQRGARLFNEGRTA